MDTLKKWELFSKQMIQSNRIAHERRMNLIAQGFKSPPPPKPDPLRPHEFPLTVIPHRGKATDKTNFTHLQELWDGVEKPLEIQTAGHRERNLTTQIK